MNVFYLGMNNTVKPWDNEKVRQAIAIGIDRKRIVDTFYPIGSEVATHFVPCIIPFGCGGSDWDGFDKAAAQKLLADAGYADGFKTKIQYRDVVRPYLPDPTVVAQDLQAQLKANLNIDATIEVQESGTFLDNNAAGTLDGLFMLGWTADWPDATNFLDYHFGAGAGKKFGTPYPDVVAALNAGAQTADTAAREAAYTQGNELIKQHVPMVPVAHSASGTAWLADVEGGVSSPLGDEFFFPVKPGTRDTVVWMQNAEPLSLYCPDETDGETIRACIQIYQGLYTVKVGGTDPLPALATECKPNAELTVWTCTLRDGVTYQDGAALDANDVVTSFSAQWDAANPLHKGRTSVFEYKYARRLFNHLAE
jgi:ABC-type transport system substrate-binding protein